MSPSPTTGSAFLDEPRSRGNVLALAHRGGWLEHTRGLENTVANFDAAYELGFRYFETDVRLCADGVLMAFHDATLDRTTDARGLLRDYTSEDLAHVRVDGREPIATLQSLLDRFPDVRFNIDIKEYSAAAELAEVLARTSAYGRVCVGSFQHRTRARFMARTHAASVMTCGASLSAMLALPALAVPAGAAVGWRLGRRALQAWDPGKVLQVPPRWRSAQLVTHSMVRRVHTSGRHVHVWTINDAATMNRLLDDGVDGLISDDLETLRDTLRRRDQWEGHA